MSLRCKIFSDRRDTRACGPKLILSPPIAISAFGYLFALALMMSGQAASITATLAGQVVSEGFIEVRLDDF